jgi:hypothetical protein
VLVGQQLRNTFVAARPQDKLPVTFDNWYTPPALCRFIDKLLKLPEVGTRAGAEQVVLQPGPQRVEVFARQRQQEHQPAVAPGAPAVLRQRAMPSKGEKETSYSYCQTHNIHTFGKHRWVITHRQAALSEAATFFIGNKLTWQAGGITRIRRHRWPVAVDHEEGNADGLAQYQVRDFEAISRHLALVAVTYSLLRAAQHDEALFHKLQRHVQTTLDGSAGSGRRNPQAQALWPLATFIAPGLAQGQTLQDVMAPLVAVFAY